MIGKLKNDRENLINILCDNIAALERIAFEQQAEIERLNNNISAMATTLSNSAKETRAEAIKGFAERLKGNCKVIGAPLITNRIDNLVKEMVGEAE